MTPTPDFEAAVEAEWARLRSEYEVTQEDFITPGYNAYEAIVDLARWARSFVLANDSVVRAMAEALRVTTELVPYAPDSDEGIAFSTCARALAAYRESVSVKEGG